MSNLSAGRHCVGRVRWGRATLSAQVPNVHSKICPTPAVPELVGRYCTAGLARSRRLRFMNPPPPTTTTAAAAAAAAKFTAFRRPRLPGLSLTASRCYHYRPATPRRGFLPAFRTPRAASAPECVSLVPLAPSSPGLKTRGWSPLQNGFFHVPRSILRTYDLLIYRDHRAPLRRARVGGGTAV